VVLVEGDTGRRLVKQLGKSGFAQLDRQPAQIPTVDLEQVEGAQHGGVCRASCATATTCAHVDRHPYSREIESIHGAEGPGRLGLSL
jgi:hypothetical protein